MWCRPAAARPPRPATPLRRPASSPGEAIVAQRVLEFLQFGGGSIVACKLEQALQVVDDGIQRTVLVIGGAAKLHAGRPLVRKLVFELLDQPGFANPRLPAQEHHLAFTLLGSLPP